MIVLVVQGLIVDGIGVAKAQLPSRHAPCPLPAPSFETSMIHNHLGSSGLAAANSPPPPFRSPFPPHQLQRPRAASRKGQAPP
eukprot:350904-Chlamydomonas_euryale.AAC.3